MKKLILLLTILFTLSTGARAQSRWGIRVAYELACPSDVKLTDVMKADAYRNGSGLSFGAVYHMPVFFNFYFEPGVNLYYNTYSVNKQMVNDMIDTDPAFDGLQIDGASVRMWGLRVPILGGYKFNLLPGLGVSVFTGPEFDLGLSAKTHVEVGKFGASENAYGDKGAFNRTDIKWNFGVGVHLGSHIFGAVSGAVGICDQARDDRAGDYKMRSNRFDITVGYNF